MKVCVGRECETVLPRMRKLRQQFFRNVGKFLSDYISLNDRTVILQYSDSRVVPKSIMRGVIRHVSIRFLGMVVNKADEGFIFTFTIQNYTA